MLVPKSLFAVCLLLVSNSGFSAARPKHNIANNYDVLQGRGSSPPTTNDRVIQDVLKILQKNSRQKFCKAYLNINIDLPCKTQTVTVTDVCPSPRCAPRTTVTNVEGVTHTLTAAAITAATPTVTTGVVGTETTTTTITPDTVTSTVGTPFTVATPEPGPQRRGIEIPSDLKKYSPGQIKAACTIFIQVDLNRVTTTKTTTVTIHPTATRKVTSTIATATITPTITPAPVVATITTSTTTVTETQTLPATTVTVCPYTRTDITSYASDQQTLGITGDTDELSCCVSCWNATGCSGWGWFPDRVFCANIFAAPPVPQPSTETCPNGNGEVGFRRRGGVENRIVAGTGPCFSGWRDVTI